MRAVLLLAAALLALPTAAIAGETITYHYDAKGRLIQVAHAGGRTDGLSSIYTFDAADNRSATSVTGAHAGVIVVPLNGLTLIPIS